MKSILRRRPSAALVLSVLALIIAMGGTSMAAASLANGNSLIRKDSLSANRLVNHTVTSKQLASTLGTAPFQSRVNGSCSASGIAKVNTNGSVGCGSTQFYAGRLVTALGVPNDAIMTVPGIGTLKVLNCLSTGANVELVNAKPGTTDIWSDGDAGFTGTGWFGANTALAVTAGATWHLGEGSGSTALVATVTASTEATGSDCIFQGTAQVTRGS